MVDSSDHAANTLKRGPSCLSSASDPVFAAISNAQGVSLSLERRVISCNVRHVLVAELVRKRLHDRIGTLARLVVLQRLHELILRLPCQRGVGRYAFAVCSMAASAGAGLGLSCLGISGRLRNAEHTEQCQKPCSQKHAFHLSAPLLSC